MNLPSRLSWRRLTSRAAAFPLLELTGFVLLFGLLAAAQLGWRPAALQLDQDRSYVVSTTPGTASWEAGVRPGDKVVALEGDSVSAPRLEIHFQHGGAIGFQGRDPAPLGLAWAAMALVCALSLFGFFNSERYWPGAAALASVIGMTIAVPALGAPLSTPFATMSMYFALRPHDHYSVRALLGAAVMSLSWRLAAFVGISPWWIITLAVIGVIALIVAKRSWGGLRRSWRSNPAASIATRAAAVVDDVLPGRTAARLRAAEMERATLADQIHSSVLPDIERLMENLENSVSPAEVERLRTVVRGELRKLMSERRLMLLDAFGLVPALEWLVEQYEKTSLEIELACAVDADAPRPPREIELAAFRVAQQALDNAARHSGASRVEVLLEQADPEACVLSVIDDGQGFDARTRRQAEHGGHQGLLDMERRSQLIGGKCVITSDPNTGTEVTFLWKK